MRRRGGAVALDHGLVAEDRERRIGGGAGQRIAGVAVGMQERVELRVLVVERVVDGVGGQHHGQRQVAAGEALGQAQVVRPDAGLLAGEHRAGAPEADGDLVGDEMHAVTVAGFAQQFEVHRVVHAHAAGALHQRLDDDRRDVVVILREGGFHVREHAACVLGGASRRARAGRHRARAP